MSKIFFKLKFERTLQTHSLPQHLIQMWYNINSNNKSTHIRKNWENWIICRRRKWYSELNVFTWKSQAPHTHTIVQAVISHITKFKDLYCTTRTHQVFMYCPDSLSHTHSFRYFCFVLLLLFVRLIILISFLFVISLCCSYYRCLLFVMCTFVSWIFFSWRYLFQMRLCAQNL